MERLVKRKNVGQKGKAQLKPRKKKEQDEVVYALTDVKETVVTENFYQPIPLSAENGRYPPTQNGDIRSLFMLFTLMAMQNQSFSLFSV